MMVFYCIEDPLSRAVAERLIREYCPVGTSVTELGQAFGGFGHIKANLMKYRDLAQRSPVFIITDLDRAECTPSLRREWLTSAKMVEPLPEKLLFCIAQSEIESWLLADTNGIATFLNVSPAKLANNIETEVVDSKEYLVSLAKLSTSSEIRSDLAPSRNSKASTGINYNHRLSQFVSENWNPEKASTNNLSLRRAITKLSSLIH